MYIIYLQGFTNACFALKNEVLVGVDSSDAERSIIGNIYLDM